MRLCFVGYTGSASTWSRALEVVGFVSLTGSLPNCSAVSSAADGIRSGMSQDCDGISQCYIFHLVVWIQRFSFQRHSVI